MSGSGIYFWFCHWFSEVSSFYMHKSIFLLFLPLTFYCSLNIMKKLTRYAWFLTFPILLFDSSSQFIYHAHRCLSYMDGHPISIALKAQSSSNLSHFLFHFLLNDCHLSPYSPCYALNKYRSNKLIKLFL